MYSIVGITGTSASGKNTVGEFLETQGYLHMDTGGIVQQEAKRIFGSTTAEHVRQAGHIIRQRLGAAALTTLAIQEYERNSDSYAGVAISGMRAPAPARGVKEAGGLLLYLDAPIELRYRRLVERGRIDVATTFEEFVVFEQEELEGGLQTGQNLQAVRELADIEIITIGTAEDTLRQVAAAVNLPQAA